MHTVTSDWSLNHHQFREYANVLYMEFLFVKQQTCTGNNKLLKSMKYNSIIIIILSLTGNPILY